MKIAALTAGVLVAAVVGAVVGSGAAAAAPPPPPPPALTAAEELALGGGEIVVRRGQAEGDPTIVVVDVAADPDRTFAAVMDMPARVADVGSLRSAEVYLDEPGRMGVRWVMGIAGISVTFHTLYQVDQAQRWCTYSLDPDQDSGLSSAGGSYQVIAVPGGSRVIYFADASASGRATPGWLRRQLQERGSRALLGGMKARAEAGAAR